MTQREIRTKKTRIALAVSFKKNVVKSLEPLSFMPNKMNCLILAAHYDDDVLGCGGTIIRHCIRGDFCKVVYMTDGSASQHTRHDKKRLTTIRKQEALRALKCLGSVSSEFWDEEDSKLLNSSTNIKRMQMILSEHHYHRIYFPNIRDSYRDHRMVGEILIDTIKKMSYKAELFMYEIIELLTIPDVYANITEDMAIKKKALDCHQTQMEYMDYSQITQYIGKMRGRQNNVEYCEVFSQVK